MFRVLWVRFGRGGEGGQKGDVFARPKELIPVLFWTGPGINLATTSVFISCAMSLAVFDIENYVDEFGNLVEPETRYTGGTVRWVLRTVPKVFSPLLADNLAQPPSRVQVRS